MHQITVTGDLKSFLPEVKIPVNIKTETHKNTVTFYSENKNELDKFKDYLINPIEKTIKTHYKDKLISREFSGIGALLTPSETAAATDYVKKHTGTDSKIKDKLRSFLSESDSLSIEGFINFRLTDFKNEISSLSANAAERILFEKEYDGFFALLKEFVSQRDPLLDAIHIIVTRCGGYYILDGRLRDITKECANSVANSLMCDEISFDDIIIYVLLTFAPQKIFLHGAEHIKCSILAETVKTVFGEKAVFCSGCAICSDYLN